MSRSQSACALVRVAPGDREHLLALLDRVLHHAAVRRQVGDVVLVDHRRREQQRALAHLRGLRPVLQELEHRAAQHDRAGRDRDVLADLNADVSTIDGIRGGLAMSRAKLAAPRTKFRAAGVERAFSTAGLVSGALTARARRATFSTAKRTCALAAPVQPGVADQPVDRLARGEVAPAAGAGSAGSRARPRP